MRSDDFAADKKYCPVIKKNVIIKRMYSSNAEFCMEKDCGCGENCKNRYLSK